MTLPSTTTDDRLIHYFGQHAIELARQAIDEDFKQNYSQAYKHYKNSLDYFMLALKCNALPPFLMF